MGVDTCTDITDRTGKYRKKEGNAMKSPIVTKMQVIPVAGYDSMLMTLSGAHAP